METVEVVIRIPKEQLERLQKIANGTWGLMNLNSEELAILNGTVLPKRHGRLIDADTYRKEMLDSREFDFFKRLDMQPTIIEADKAGDTDGNS